jgi:hypothetical protein
MRRVEVTATLSPRLWSALKSLLDVDEALLRAAWDDCSRPDRGYFTAHTQHPATGKKRELHIPSPQMRLAQRRILSQVLYALPVSPAAYGGVPGRSYVQAANLHLSAPGHLMQLDVADAFPSTTYGMISERLRAALKPHVWVFGLSREERKALVGWLTHMMVVNPEGGRFPRLPLGTPTSVAAFNMVWAEIDAELTVAVSRLLGGRPFRYSRYVDDMTFSADEPLPADLEGVVAGVLSARGYTLNRSKTRAAPREGAVVHGLCWSPEGVTLPNPAVLNMARRAHRVLGIVSGHPTSSDWREAAKLLADLEIIGAQVYQGGARPAGLMLPPDVVAQIKQHADRPTPRWADELWG